MKDLNLNEGDSLTLSADADGEGITYTWQYKSPGADWVLWGNGTPMTTRYKADYTWDGIKYRLVVKDQYGNEAYSNEATVNVKIKLRFLSTLQNVTINEGVIATFKANVVGNGLTYTWQYQSPGKSWVNWGSQYQKNPMTTDYKADGSWNGIKYRVIVKDKWGQTVTSEASVRIKMMAKGEGVDVSKYQGNIDWSVTKNYVQFAIIRVNNHNPDGSYTGTDPYFVKNITEAKANGVQVGIYYYSNATTTADAIYEANQAIAMANQYGGITFPIFIDSEGAQQSALSVEQRTANIQAFIDTVNAAGYKGGVYSSKLPLENNINTTALRNAYVWVAQYNTSCTYKYPYNMWQYISQGSVPGITGNVDRDVVY